MPSAERSADGSHQDQGCQETRSSVWQQEQGEEVWSEEMKYFLPALALLFIALKLTNHIAWSWWLVTSPLWGGFALFLLVIILYAIHEVLSKK
jgi:hypothetical protein